MLSRAFKSGNSLAIRIPKELAFIEVSQTVEIERVQDTLIIRVAVPVSLGQALQQACAGFSPDFMAEGRLEGDDDEEREGWLVP